MSFFIYICKKRKQMNFTTLSDDLSKEFNMSKRQALKMTTFLMSRMREKLIFGQHVNLYRVGTLVLKVRKSKPFPSVKTKKMEISKKKYYLALNVSPGLKTELKKKTVY